MSLGEIGDILARAKQVAIDYYRLTGKPLGITGEVGEYEAARLLKLKLAIARTPGFDATDQSGSPVRRHSPNTARSATG